MDDPAAADDGGPGSAAPDGAEQPPPAERAGHPARHRARRGPLHRALRAGQLWPVAAIALLAVLGLRLTRVAPRPGEGLLAADGFSLTSTRAGLPDPVLSPDGLGALHVAVYATLTRAFDRYDTLLAAGRELLVVAALASAVLVWRTGRRLGLGDPACALAVLLAGVPALLPPAGLVDLPARLAVPWLLAAAWLTVAGRATPAAWVLAAVAAVIAVLLAPETLLLLLAGASVGWSTRGNLRAWRLAGALAAGLLFVVVALLLDRWDPGAASAAAWDLRDSAAVAALACCVGIGALAAWRLPRLRPAGAALVAAGVVGLAGPGRLAVLTVCLPVAALLAAALLEDVLASRAAAARLVAAAAALGLVVTGVAVATVGPAAPPDARALRGVLDWSGGQLRGGAALAAPRRVWAELLHAGGDEARVRLPGTADAAAPVVTVAETDPPAGARLLARFEDSGAALPLVVADPAPGTPTDEELQRRRSLARAILANPRTEAGGTAAAVLEAADVDQRLLTLLAGLTAQYGLGIADFPAAPGEPTGGERLARSVLLNSLGGAPLEEGAAATDRLRSWLGAQLPPFAPDDVAVLPDGVLVGFRYHPAPDALVSQATP